MKHTRQQPDDDFAAVATPACASCGAGKTKSGGGGDVGGTGQVDAGACGGFIRQGESGPYL